MCGRYELHSHPTAIALAFGLAYPPEIHARFNIAPTQQVPIIRLNADGERELVQVRWGLVPRWAKDPSIGVKMINARAETISTKSAYATAYRRHRCLLPADGFYEWTMRADGGKQPIWVGMKDGSVFGLAGLHERWLSPDGEPLDTCTIVTTEANALLGAVHGRMPVIVAPEAYEAWLDPSTPDVEPLLAPYDARAMTYWPVSTRVNSVKNDDAALIAPIAANEGAAAEEPVQTELPVDIDDADLDEEGAVTPQQTQLF